MFILFKKEFIISIYFIIIIKCNIISDKKNNKNEVTSLIYESDNFKSDKLNLERINDSINFKLNESKIFIGHDSIYSELGNEKKLFSKLICFFFILISIISIILIYFDFKDDKIISRQYNLSTSQKANEEYKKLKNTNISKGTFSFSFFLMKYIYPLSGILYIYNFDYPRYIRFIVCIINYLFNILITIFIYYIHFYSNSKPELEFLFPNFILTILISIIFHFLGDLIIGYLLNYEDKRRNIFKPKFENLRKYTYYTIKKDILFNSKWQLIRNRILSYYRICGKYILINKKLDKYGKYVKNKIMNINGKYSDIRLSHSFNNQDEEKNFDRNSGLTERLLPPSNNYDNKIRESTNNLKTSIINNKSYPNENTENNNNLKIEKGCEPFSFSRFGINNMKLKTVKKIEDIRNRYINKIAEVKYDETLEDNYNAKTYNNLEIEVLDNYTYISTDKMTNKLKYANSSSNKMFLNIFTNIITLILLVLVTQGLFIIYFQINKEDEDKEKIFYVSIFIIIFIIDLVIYYLISLFIAFSIPKLYGKKKKNCLNKLIFKLFIEKYIVYLYKMRLLLIKYHKEFEYIDK